jgi:maltooligosyltrehalose trehalohydrolase
MRRFEVWAPRPERVELVLEGERRPMTAVPGGWWRAEVDDAPAGTRYGFSLDGGPARPDPRSHHQPEGVDGPSAVVDHSAFEWHDGGWRGIALPGAVLYELHIGTFSPEGTFDGAVARLDHLVALGVDAVEIMPVAEFSGDRGWGYDGVDLFAPHHAYGGPDGLKRLVDACHGAGLGVVMDVVYNHLGPAGSFLPEFGPYLSEHHHTAWGDAVNFDGEDSDEVRRFVVDNACHWLDRYHCDGLRLDAVHAIVDTSATSILEEIGQAVAALGAHLRRPLFVIAESDLNDPRLVRRVEAGGLGLDAAWADGWHHGVHVALTGEAAGYYEDYVDADVLPKALEQAWVLDGTWSAHRRRRHGRSPQGLDPHRFVVCAQNHDQVGNRAAGDRRAALMSEGRLRIAAALLLTSPFVPMIFQGEEWAAGTPFQYFTGHPDTSLGAAVSHGRRQEFIAFGWDPADVPDPQDLATFERSKLDWSEPAGGAHRRALDWHRRLIALRRCLPVLTDRRVTAEAAYDAGRLTVRRGPVLVAANLADSEITVTVEPGTTLLADGRARLEGAVRVVGPEVVLPVDSVVILHDPR